ncbi:hypothetical protein Micbo1qcDRAFT_164882, partial [Microdochium bolleyi]
MAVMLRKHEHQWMRPCKVLRPCLVAVILLALGTACAFEAWDHRQSHICPAMASRLLSVITGMECVLESRLPPLSSVDMTCGWASP